MDQFSKEKLHVVEHLPSDYKMVECEHCGLNGDYSYINETARCFIKENRNLVKVAIDESSTSFCTT